MRNVTDQQRTTEAYYVLGVTDYRNTVGGPDVTDRRNLISQVEDKRRCNGLHRPYLPSNRTCGSQSVPIASLRSVSAQL